MNQAEQLYQQVLKTAGFDSNEVRNELGGVLLRTGRATQAIQLYATRKPDLDGRLILARAHLHLKEYAAAETDANAVLAERPDDMPAQLLLLRALVLQGKYVESGALVHRLFQESPDSVPVRTEMGQLGLVQKDYNRVLLLFQGLLEDKQPLGDDYNSVLHGYIDAASGAEDIGLIKPEVLKLVEKVITDRPIATEATYVARLAWVLERAQQPSRAAELLHRLIVLHPESADYRQRYVHDLNAAGRGKEAVAYLESLPSTPDNRRMLVELYISQKDFAAAEKICQDILRNNPFSVRGKLLLAEIQLAQKNDKEARRLLAQVRQENTMSLETHGFFAELLLWAGESAIALAEYRELLEKKFDQPALWRGYISAASAAPTIPAEDNDLILRIAGKTLTTDHDPVFLARLAWVLQRLEQPEESRQALDGHWP